MTKSEKLLKEITVLTTVSGVIFILYIVISILFNKVESKRLSHMAIDNDIGFRTFIQAQKKRLAAGLITKERYDKIESDAIEARKLEKKLIMERLNGN